VLADSYNDVNRAYGLNKGRPQTIVLDRDHTLVLNEAGTAGHHAAEELILELLAE
jgi:hypothetical protein